MTIQFFINHSENNKIDKTLTNGATLTGSLKEESSVVNPKILIEDSGGIVNYNYAYIPEFKRYYFITDVESVRNGLWRVSMKVDVLMSFKDQIKQCTGIVENSTNSGSYYLNGNQWVSTCKSYTDIINFSNGFSNDGEFILITAGG